MVNRVLLACPYRDRREPGDDPVPKIRIIRTPKCACIRHETGVRLSLYWFFVRFGITFTTRAQAKIAYLYFERRSKLQCIEALEASLSEISVNQSVSLELENGKWENDKSMEEKWKERGRDPLSTILVAGFLAWSWYHFVVHEIEGFMLGARCRNDSNTRYTSRSRRHGASRIVAEKNRRIQ